MPEKSISYPKVCKRYDDLYYVDFRLSNKRYRLFSGSKIGSSLSPNTYPLKLRRAKAIELADEVYRYLISNNYSFNKKLDNVGLFDYLIQKKLSEPLSKSYHKCLNSIAIKLRNELLAKGNISVDFIDSISLRNNNNTSYNTTRRHVNVLINYLFDNGFNINKSKLKNRKQKEALHKSIINVKDLLEDIKIFNYNLYLCALLTYGCLLRPHQEVRNLKWSDFNSDLSFISLSGDKIKSKRNRIVPVPSYIRDILVKGERDNNIFSGKRQPLNQDYFKTLWGRFKRQSNLLEQDQTLYSFRHSGAIEIFKRTGSITKLQKAMGHSSINVSLTYLRGLEIAELKEGDMPTLL